MIFFILSVNKNQVKWWCEWQAGLGRNCKEGDHLYVGAECLERGRTVSGLHPVCRACHTSHFLFLDEATGTARVSNSQTPYLLLEKGAEEICPWCERSLFYHGQKKLQALKFHLSPSRPPREWMPLESQWYVSSPRGECAHRVGGSLQKLFGCGSCRNTLGHPPRSGVSQSLSVLSILPTGDQLERFRGWSEPAMKFPKISLRVSCLTRCFWTAHKAFERCHPSLPGQRRKSWRAFILRIFGVCCGILNE